MAALVSGVPLDCRVTAGNEWTHFGSSGHISAWGGGTGPTDRSGRSNRSCSRSDVSNTPTDYLLGALCDLPTQAPRNNSPCSNTTRKLGPRCKLIKLTNAKRAVRRNHHLCFFPKNHEIPLRKYNLTCCSFIVIKHKLSGYFAMGARAQWE